MTSWTLFALFVASASLVLWFSELEPDQSDEGEASESCHLA